MYKNLPNICYECGATLDKESLTKEHVPPKSFFPKSDRDSLITVPACVKHNGGKSDDDEYFFHSSSRSPRSYPMSSPLRTREVIEQS